MFTGIIEEFGKIIDLKKNGSNIELEVEAQMVGELKVDQSVAHNGVCLTVTKKSDKTYFVTAVEETLKKTNLGNLKPGDIVNLERAMLAHGRFDGHIVQGHVDQT